MKLNVKTYSEPPTDFNVFIGKDELGNDLILDILKLPHLFIGGISGSGKSNLVHRIISTLSSCVSPNILKLILIDSKKIELNVYDGLPHLLTPVIIENKKAILAMKWARKEMDRRLEVLRSYGVRNIHSYHGEISEPGLARFKADPTDLERVPETMPYIMIVIDGLSDIMKEYPKEVEEVIAQLTQAGHIVGIHFIISTSRISSKIIPETIKVGMPSRIAFKVSSVQDSTTIIGSKGAELLAAKGEILFQSGSMKYPVCVQTLHISDTDINDVANAVRDEYKEEDSEGIELDLSRSESSVAFDAIIHDGDESGDDLFEAAKELVISAGKASTSYIQRKLGIGYSRAARMLSLLEQKGVIGPANGAKPRDVIIKENVY